MRHTFVEEALDVEEDVGERRQRFSVFEQLRQIVGRRLHWDVVVGRVGRRRVTILAHYLRQWRWGWLVLVLGQTSDRFDKWLDNDLSNEWPNVSLSGRSQRHWVSDRLGGDECVTAGVSDCLREHSLRSTHERQTCCDQNNKRLHFKTQIRLESVLSHEVLPLNSGVKQW